MDIINDFDKALEEELDNEFKNELEEDVKYVVISLQRRNNKKSWTVIEDLEIDNSKQFVKFVKKNLHCNGKYDKDKKIYQFQGNHMNVLKDMISDIYKIDKENIVTRS